MLNISLGKDVRFVDLVIRFLSNGDLLQLVQTNRENVKYRNIVVKRKYEHVEKLDFRHKRINCISSELGQLQALHYLNLSHNQLACVPADAFGVGQLQALRYLDLSYNQLACVPADAFGVGQLQALRELDLSH